MTSKRAAKQLWKAFAGCSLTARQGWWGSRVTAYSSSRVLTAQADTASRQGGNGQDQWASERDVTWRTLAAAAAVAAGVTLVGQPAHMEQASPADTLRVAKSAVLRAWSEVDEDLHRAEAALPAAAITPRAQPPEVRLAGDQVAVKWRLRQGADLSALLAALVGVMAPGTLQDGGQAGATRGVQVGELNLKVALCGVSRVLQFEPRGDQAPGAPRLGAQVFVPTIETGPVEVEVYKAGQLAPEDIRAIRTLLRTSNTVSWDDTVPLGHHRVRRSFDLSSALSSQLGGLFEELTRDLPPEMRSLLPSADHWGRLFSLPGEGRGTFEVEILTPESEGASSDEDESEFGLARPPRRRRDAWGMPMPGEAHNRKQGQQQESAAQLDDAWQRPEAQRAAKQLELMGVTVYPPGKQGEVDWGLLAGYDEQKREIEDTILLALKHPEVYDELARKTRRHFASNRPRAVLFEGPPGCGKTTSARVISNQAAVPLIAVPLEALASKWYGESERNLAQLFKHANAMGGALVFLDELDSLATSRQGDMHEATRRLLGVLLRQLDGFAQDNKSVVIGATNRTQDLDPALLSRFDTTIEFGLPNDATRRAILAQYAQHLAPQDLARLAAATPRASGRDLRDIAEQAERRWASKIIRGQVSKDQLPPVEEYLDAAAARMRELRLAADGSPTTAAQDLV